MAEATITAPATHSQPSRKGKKAWRKNVDISEVTSGLDTVREEIIKTGGVIAEKDADELFATDVTGDAEIAKQVQRKKLLKSEEILAQRSAVPGLEGRKRKAAEGPVLSSGKRQRNGTYVPYREVQRLRNVADNATGGVQVDEQSPWHDPWIAVPAVKDPQLDFLDEEVQPRVPRTLQQPPLSLSANGIRIPNVTKPSAGKSYNPLVGDWSALLDREGEAAVEAEKQRLAAEAAAAEQEARAAEEAAKVEAAEKEEYATDYESAWESEWDGIHSGAEQEVFTHKPQRRKPQAERNKIRARKEREAEERMARKQKEREAQEKRISQIAKEMSAKDQARRSYTLTLQRQSENLSASDVDEELELRRPRFGKLPIPQAPLEVVLPDELQDSLRRLKPEGNLLTDRYRNLLINGKVEVRRKQWQRKQAKKERLEKWTYKDWTLK